MPFYAFVNRAGKRYPIGAFARNPSGWRFIPYTQNQPSRRNWPTPEDALPQWAHGAEIIEAKNLSEALKIAELPPKPALSLKELATALRDVLDSLPPNGVKSLALRTSVFNGRAILHRFEEEQGKSKNPPRRS